MEQIIFGLRKFKFVQINGQALKIGLGHLKIFFRTIKPEKLNFTWKLSDLERNQVKIMAPEGKIRQIEMKCIFDIVKNIFIWAKVSQVSDLAHGPLVICSFTTS
jgi:hypothetical protein